MSEVTSEQRAVMDALGRRARAAARALARTSEERRVAALLGMATALEGAVAPILAANARDLAAADARGLSGAMRDRLVLNADRVGGMAKGLREVAEQPALVGQVFDERVRPNGLKVSRVRIPLGVIGIVYEARPNVTADAAGLCIKSGNAVFLRGGSEAAHSNDAILAVLRGALETAGLPADAVMTLPSTDRLWIQAMLEAEAYLDVIIPRGGEALIRFVVAHSRIPVIKHYKGVCHVYVDAAADFDRAIAITVNAKASRPGVCNSAETLLVHRAVAAEFLPRVAEALKAAGVELRGCPETCALLPEATPATVEDWHAEFLDLILAVKVVDDLDAAIAHIETYGSDHTEVIVSKDETAVARFLAEVQSSVVMANASSRFSDGGQLGLGAEIGISTTRLHAYGPMGAEHLTTLKYVIVGDGQVRT